MYILVYIGMASPLDCHKLDLKKKTESKLSVVFLGRKFWLWVS